MRARALRAVQHLPHESVLRKDAEIIFESLLRHWILLGLNEIDYQHLSCDGVERIQLDCLLNQWTSFVGLSKMSERVCQIGIGRRDGRPGLKRAPEMANSIQEVAVFQISPSQRGLHQSVLRVRLLQLIEGLEIRGNVLRFVLRKFSVRL